MASTRSALSGLALACLLAVSCAQTLAPKRGEVYKCTWSDREGTCGANTYYFLSTQTPTPTNPYTRRILGVVAKDYKCAVHKSARACNRAFKDTCIWDPAVGCSYALTNEWACPGSRAANFLKCDYFNLVRAPAAGCLATPGCTWTKGRGCFEKGFSAWGPNQLRALRGNITEETVPLAFYGCCSSFLSRRDLYPETCYELEGKAACDRAAKVASCTWAPATRTCGLTPDGIYQAELEGLRTADPPFGVAYAAADDECFAITSKAACRATTAKLDARKLARFQAPHREAALNYRTFCGTTILGA